MSRVTQAGDAPSSVRVWTDTVVLPTYLPAPPDKNPMFLEKRVYQGSSGRVYPLSFTDRIAEEPVDRSWKAVWLENEFLRVLVLPEIGGRIHAIQDRTNGYDLVYRQPVIKPALVGLVGPWISGGIEFNWPQHHRPGTFLPVDFDIEEHADGSRTVWCSDHDPLTRMKGMHGICLHPGRAYVEVKVRVYNRTPVIQTFLWWANVATRVHEAYQSFFPPDVQHVADHARRSMTEYPLAEGWYYGVDYGERGRKGVRPEEAPSQFQPPHLQAGMPFRSPRARPTHPELPDYAPNDLSFYANIPTPCSYMCMGSAQDFFGGYDYAAEAGLIHIANHHIAPGKKQWTWGNHEFGYAWDRNLTNPDPNGVCWPYIELMAGVYTDNQPDFSFLQPGETKTWSQFWYAIQKIGPPQQANLDAAVSLRLEKHRIRVGVSVTRAIPNAVVRLERRGGALEWDAHIDPGKPFLVETRQTSRRWKSAPTTLRLLDAEGNEIMAHRPEPASKGDLPPAATEPPEPREIASADELYLTGLHLDQYRHATRSPAPYWREALRRDSLDARCNNAIGQWHLKRGEFVQAESHFRRAIERLTCRNPNPYDGEPYYHLGLCLRHLGRDTEAYDAFYKATWSQAWAGAGYHALAELDCKRHAWTAAIDHLERSLRLNADHLRARNLMVLALRRMQRPDTANQVLEETLALDRLDWWARHLNGESIACDLQVRLDVAHDYARAGFLREAAGLLQSAAGPRGELPDQSWGALPLVHYTLGWLYQEEVEAWAAAGAKRRPVQARASATSARISREAQRQYRIAAGLPPEYCFPARLEEIAVLEAAARANSEDSRAPYYLGNLLYDRRRHEEAIALWERSARLDPKFSIVWRNLGIGYFNIRRQPAKARAAYDRALRADPLDARLLYERDQLWKRLGETPETRLRELEKRPDLVRQRDDLSVELCALYNQTGRHDAALALIQSRMFQPWEGGEGGPIGQWTRSHVALGDEALHVSGRPGVQRETRAHLVKTAVAHFRAALTAPANLGEARHLLANQSDLHYWLGCALEASGDREGARRSWRRAAAFKGDFQEMSVRAFSEMTYYSALAWRRLGRQGESRKLLRELLEYARHLAKSEAKIDYFATSLPTMLLFEDDLPFRQQTTALFLQAQAQLGLGRTRPARALLTRVLQRDPNHAMAADLTRRISRDRHA
ncbi:MAG: DUF5107 domain-containing protein [Verrucomicrobiia bacterium]